MWNINPFIALSIFAIISVFVLYIFWPRMGLIAKYYRSARNSKKELMEDALKHLYDYELHNLNSTINSVAGNLGISTDKSSKIIENLKRLKLVSLSGQSLNLTDDGRSYALRVIRIHRLWENYLAEETGIKEIDWHDEAEIVEHSLSPDDADRLSAKMGNPKFDPHGDPIPDADGNVHFNESLLLNNVSNGDIIKIIHIEDEPKAIYKELIAQGLYPGKKVLVLEKTNETIVIANDGEENVLTALMASKVSVQILTDKEFSNKRLKTLIDLKPGEIAEVLSVSPNCRGQQRRRLLDFGIVPGSAISIHMKNPLQDPTAYLVKDTIVALRNSQASKVFIKHMEN